MRERKRAATNYLPLPHRPLLSSNLVTTEEEEVEVDLVANMRVVRVKCHRIVRSSSSIRQQASLILPSSSRPKDPPILAIQGSNRATTSIILGWQPTIPSTTIPLARLVTLQTTIRGMSKAPLLLLPILSLDLATTRTCTLQVTKSCQSKYNFS